MLEVDGAEHPECGVPPATVVDHLNPARDTRACSIPGRPALPVVELGLQCRPERFSHRVVKAHPFAAGTTLPGEMPESERLKNPTDFQRELFGLG